jgi:hypothetical protein
MMRQNRRFLLEYKRVGAQSSPRRGDNKTLCPQSVIKISPDRTGFRTNMNINGNAAAISSHEGLRAVLLTAMVQDETLLKTPILQTEHEKLIRNIGHISTSLV